MAIIDSSEVSLVQGVNEQVINEGMWYLDNRASNHMIGDFRLFVLRVEGSLTRNSEIWGLIYDKD